MSFLPYAAAAWLLLVGFFGVVRSRNLIGIVICLSVAQSATYVLLLAIGYRTGGTAPIFDTIPRSRKTVDPIVQALTLTDVVVGVTVAALLLAIAIQVYKRHGTLDPNELRDLHG